MADIELRNDTNLEFIDISTEAIRMYEFDEEIIEITRPQWLNVSESGGHRILDGDGIGHYIPWGWLHLFWVPKEGAPHFVK